MQPFHERLIEEVKDLNTKINKLIEFKEGYKFTKLSPAHKELLRSQLIHMQAYSGILHERLNLLDEETTTT